MRIRLASTANIIVAAALGAASPADAQDTTKARRATVTAGSRYEADGLKLFLLGRGWRDLWTTPISAPVFDPATFAGGLKFDRRGGGRQSITVHFKEEKGPNGYVFRSVDKFPVNELAPEFNGSLAGRIIQDQTSAFLPAAPILVPPLLRAVGALHLDPKHYVMADNAGLGALGDTVAGMLGTVERKPKEGPDDTPGFAGSRKIEDTDEFLEALRSSHAHRVDERDLLANRLIDFLINDTDRTPDNYDWARFGSESEGYVWRTIARDRDWAFMNAGGLVHGLVISRIYPKVLTLEPKYRYKGLVFSSFQVDRRLLQRLTSRDFRDVAVRVQSALTDPVIAQVIGAMPAEWRTTESASRLSTLLRARRDKLVDVAMRFYHDLATDVDLYGTDLADRVDVVRHNDGRVTVTIEPRETVVAAAIDRREDGRVVTEVAGSVASARDAYYQRTFIPPETQEIRIHLGEGDDLAVIRGARTDAITVRVVGEKGSDTFADSARGGATRFYDDQGESRVLAGPGVNTRKWTPPAPKVGLRLESAWRPDWGGSFKFGPTLDHHTGAGLVVGGGPRWRSYGFRRLPHHWSAGANVLVGTLNRRAAVAADLDYRFENSPLAFTIDARASEIEGFRFFGYGNDSPEMPSSAALVEQRVVALEPALVWRIGWRAREDKFNRIRGEVNDSTALRTMRPLVGKLDVGPSVSWIDPEPVAGSPLAVVAPRGAEKYSLAGARLALQLDGTDDSAMPTRGWTLKAAAAAYPALLGLDQAFGTVSGTATTYVPMVRGGLHLALRAGGAAAAGDAPVQFAPSIGGRSSLRGFSSRRFTGDASAFGGVELRQPVGTVNFVLKSKLGVFALADAGRVWLDGGSNGGWHTGVGGGLWVAALGKSVSVAYAQGEGGRLYLRFGQSY